jgi:hypothetical protein
LLSVKSYKPGDYIVMVDKKGVRFNEKLQSLSWGIAETVNVELLHYENGNGLFRVRGAAAVPVPAKP